jgi:hypothetical protein
MAVTVVTTGIKNAGADTQPVFNGKRETVRLSGNVGNGDTGTYAPKAKPILDDAGKPVIIGLGVVASATYSAVTGLITWTTMAANAALNVYVDILCEK